MEAQRASDLEEGRRMKDELQSLLYTPGNNERYFPDDRWEKIKKNFNLFDRDGDEYINLEECFELLNSLDIDIPERDVRLLYLAIVDSSGGAGIQVDAFKLILTKKIKDDDKMAELNYCFSMVDPMGTGAVTDLEMFKELLMSKGLKFSEEEADEFLAEANPKKDVQFNYNNFVNIILTRKKEKKKGMGKGKKKK
mmetsp:Transcript_16206/g.18601  ORF Transcript_16206/g.18601 Transcript_16206/m.18601 type:complete len:195 (+) Transcript_16206:6-590(+)